MKYISEIDSKIKSKGEKIRVGTRLVKQLSTTFYPNPLVIFDELVSNANDALADLVTITLGNSWITVEDNGEGMTPDGLVKFFYISHTSKEESRERSFKGIKRAIIGKFGIGKISLYQLCKEFEIVTWRDSVESSATFDFEKFEEAKFIDSFDLMVKSKPSERKGSGTLITLMHLKHEAVAELSLRSIKRRLSRTIPLSDNFKVTIQEAGGVPITITSEQISETKVKSTYDIEDNVPEVGRVYGKIRFFSTEDQDNQGVFIKVLGRLVNSEEDKNGVRIINLNAISHPQMFANKIRVDINADGLNEVLLTNRAGFIETSQPYKNFIAWLKKIINEKGSLEYRNWLVRRENIEKTEMPSSISKVYEEARSVITQFKERPRKEKPARSGKSTREPTAARSRVSTLRELMEMGKLKIEVRDMGISEAEAFFDRQRQTLVVNSSNPSYVFARSHGRLQGTAYHIFKAAAVLIALESASDLDEFRSIYNAIAGNVDLLDGLDKSLRKR